jgi:hypothetical protein
MGNLADLKPKGPSGRRTCGATCPISANSALATSGCGWPPGAGTCAIFSPAISDASISSGTFSGSGAMADRINAGGPPRNTVAGSACPFDSATA